MSAVVGLIGKKRSGKDSFAQTLVEEFGFRRFAFADPLKEAALRSDPIVRTYVTLDEEYLDHVDGIERLSSVVSRLGWEDAKEIPEVRRTLQNYGVAIREIEPDFWVRATLDRALLHASTSGPVVVTDVRFPNEAQEIRDAGGKIVRIIRPGLVSDDTHASEIALDDYEADVEVLNDRDLETLATVARSLHTRFLAL